MAESAAQRARTQVVQDLTGATVGRFVVRRHLGTGGMGQVYLAEDTRLKRAVALKRMAPHLSADQRYRQRFLKEAECASQLSDPHIADIYDVFEENGEIFLVMEYVDGESLRQRLRRSVPLEELLEVATQCASALAAAHSRGIVHRDLKPENIMLTAALQVKILDFGLAKIMPHAHDSTIVDGLQSSAAISGTPAYMAPETLLERQADGRSDIFSLGVTLYEMATGQHPFLADTFLGTAERVLHHTPPPIGLLNSKVPAELTRSVTKMLCKDPAERYATSADMLVDLRALHRAQGFPLLSPPSGTLSQEGALRTPAPTAVPTPSSMPAPPLTYAAEPENRTRRIWMGLALIGVLGIGAAVYGLWPGLRQLLSTPAPATTSQTPPNASPTPLPSAANQTSSAPETELPPTETQPVRPTPKKPEPSIESQPIAHAGNTPAAKKENTVRSRPGAKPAEGADSDTEKPHTTPGMGDVEVVTDVMAAHAVLTGPAGKNQECNTPCRFDDLQPGRYTMEITKEGYRPLRRILAVSANKIVTENRRLEAQQAAIRITTDPPGAEIFVDGQRRPELTPASVWFAPGRHAITVQKAGYERHESSVDLKDEDFYQLRVTLGQGEAAAASQPAPQVKIVGWVMVKTVPRGADILVDNNSTGHKTPFRLELPPGQHTVTLFLKRYKAAQRTVVVKENQGSELNEVLSQP
jgi:serine/threonine protein kinase